MTNSVLTRAVKHFIIALILIIIIYHIRISQIQKIKNFKQIANF